MSEVKRYGFRIGMPSRGNVETIISVEDHIGDYVKFEDYEKLKAQLERAENDLRYYANKSSWIGYHRDCTSVVDDCVIDKASDGFKIVVGGKRAREYFKEKEQV